MFVANLKQWNEGLAREFLTSPGTHGLAMENSTIETIGEKLGIDKSNAIEDFLKSMLSKDSGYENKYGFGDLDLHDFDGSEESPIRIFENARTLRNWYKKHMRLTGNAQNIDLWKYPDDIIPWLSHLALIILSSSANVANRAGPSRYLPIFDYVSKYLLGSNRGRTNNNTKLEKHFKTGVLNCMFPHQLLFLWSTFLDKMEKRDGSTIYFYDNWTFLNKWSRDNDTFEGNFLLTAGNVQFAVPKHLFLRDKDRTYIYKIFKDSGISRSIPLDESWLINKINSDEVKDYNWSPKIVDELKKKKTQTVQTLAEFMKYLWEAENFEKELEERLSRNSGTTRYPHLKRTFFFTPYLYIEDNEIVTPIQVRLHKSTGKVMADNEVVEVNGKEFIFERDNEVSEPVDIDNHDTCFDDGNIIEIMEGGDVIATVSPLMHILSKGHGKKIIITRDEFGMYGYNSERQLSKGYELSIIRNRAPSNLSMPPLRSNLLKLTNQIGLKKKDAELGNSSRTKVEIEGGVKISKNNYAFKGKESFPKMRLIAGKKEDVKFFPGGDWGSYFEEEPKLGEDTEGRFWSFNPKVSGGQGNVIEMKITYKYTYEEKNNEIKFNLHIENNGVSWREHAYLGTIKSKMLHEPMELKIFERDFTPTPESIEEVVEETVGGMGKEDKVEADEDAIEEIIRRPSLEQSREYWKSLNGPRMDKKFWNDEHKIRDYLENSGHKWDRGSWSSPSKNEIRNIKRETPEDENNKNNNEDTQKDIKILATNIADAMVGIIEPTRPPPVERKECEVCNSCGTPLVGKGYTKFKCINCEIWIGRCRKCRTNSRKYLCGKLDDVCFEGP